MRKVLFLSLIFLPLPVHSAGSGPGQVLLSTGAAASSIEVSTETISFKIVHPYEGQKLPFVRSSFVYGSADPSGKLFIYGKPVPVHPGGGFITMVDYSTGTFRIKAELQLPATALTQIRTVNVASLPGPLPAYPLAIEYAMPDKDLTLLPGDVFFVKCKGSPGCKANFTLQGTKEKFPMIETEPAKSGIYKGSFILGQADACQNSKIQVTLSNKKRGAKISKFAAGRITCNRGNIPWVVEVTSDAAIMKTGRRAGPDDYAGYMLFPPKETRLYVAGRSGKELKIRLNKTREAWINEDEVITLPEGTPYPRAVAENILVSAAGKSALVKVPVNEKVPFEIISSPDGKIIDIRLFGVISNTDWINCCSSGSAIEQVQWFQEDSETYMIRVCAKSNWLGYDGRFEGGNFVFELRSPPVMKSSFSLEGLTVAIDAGHTPDTGAVGPTGLMEKDANQNIALQLQDELLKEKANVVMLRQKDEPLKLYDRPKRAWQARADILISIHNNALPEGQSPFEKNGYGVYYFYPRSLNLAKEISKAYGDMFGPGRSKPAVLRDDGLYYGNLTLTRVSQMPAVLIESAYIIIPEEEALLRTKAFQQSCAKAIVSGLKQYIMKESW